MQESLAFIGIATGKLPLNQETASHPYTCKPPHLNGNVEEKRHISIMGIFEKKRVRGSGKGIRRTMTGQYNYSGLHVHVKLYKNK